MADYANMLKIINELHNTHLPIDMCDALPNFPFPKMYAGQKQVIEEMQDMKSFVLSSHTGSGKTPVFLTLTRDQPTIVIEPRKFLQKQVQHYFKDAILFGRSEYPCAFAANAGIAPCLEKTLCSKTYYKDICESYSSPECIRKPCRVFLAHENFHIYPCNPCAYLEATNEAVRILHHNGTVICNFGNFWNLLQHCVNVIVDEADLFFKEVSSPRILYTATKLGDIKEMLNIEIKDLEKQLNEAHSGNSYRIQNLLYNMQFLLQNHEICFAYTKVDRRTKKERVYVEINPAHTNVLKDKLFAGKRVIIVTATPSDFSLPVASYQIWQRCGIYFTPVGKLTSRELGMRPWLLDHAGTFIQTMSSIFEGLYESKKFVVHCGNIGNHATKINDILNTLHEKNVCTLHESGNLMGTIDTFVESDKRYLLVASAEYGADFTWCNCQYILKFPFASYDDRVRALERTLGKEKFRTVYTMDAISRMIQQCGRVGRGYDSFGCTFILDGKFREIYQQYNGAFPDWFKNRLHSGVF